MDDVTANARIAGLVLAAGAGRRFGAPKQLAALDGRPLLEHALAAVAAVPGLDRVVVALGAQAEQILARVRLHGAEPILVHDWADGQSASLRAGVAALGSRADAILVTLGDQPRLAPAAIARVLGAWDGTERPVRAVYAGRPGHPVLLPRALYPAVERLRGDAGARDLLDAARAREVECGAETVLDVDTPAQLAALQAPPGSSASA
jgi:molybdenum cofactor cytidylyltransferase